jgi:hypothetical protein
MTKRQLIKVVEARLAADPATDDLVKLGKFLMELKERKRGRQKPREAEEKGPDAVTKLVQALEKQNGQ